jgi:hypothetical protein
VRGHRGRLVGRGDHDRQGTAAGIGLDPGQQRHAAFDPGVYQDEVGQPLGQRGDRLAITMAVVEFAAPTAQAHRDELERLARPLHDD